MKRMNRILAGIMLLPLLSTAAGLKQDPKLITGKLPNGLTYYIYPNDNPKGEAIFRLFIKSGSLYEDDDQKGLAHFLEHMAFNGSEDFPNGTLVGYLKSKGAGFGTDINAHTSMNETVYKLTMPTASASLVDTTIMVLANWAGKLTIDSAAMEKERGIILSEWLSKTGPQDEANTVFLQELLNGSRYAQRKTIGDTAVIRNAPRERLVDYYTNWYNPKLMAVAVAGDVDAAQIQQSIVKYFASIPSARIKLRDYKIDDYKKPEFKSVGNSAIKTVELNTLQLMDLSAAVKDEKTYFEYLKRVMINKLTAERFSYLVYSEPAYKSASISLSPFINTKTLLAGGVSLKPGEIEAGIRQFAFESERIYRYGFLKLEIDKAKKSYINSLRRRSENPKPPTSDEYISEMYSLFYRGDEILTKQGEYQLALKYIDRIDSACLARELHKVRDLKKTHYFLTYSDKVESELPSGEQIMNLFDSLSKARIEPFRRELTVPDNLLEQQPEPGKVLSTESLEEIGAYKLALSNGARVIFKQSDLDKGKVSLSGFRNTGIYCLDSTYYVSGLFAMTVVPGSGAGAFSREALSYYLTGTSYSVRLLIDKTRSGIVCSANTEDADKMFELAYLRWMYPRMDTTVLATTKKATIESINNELKTDADKFSKDLGILVNGINYVTRPLTDTIINNELDPSKLVDIHNLCFGGAQDFDFIIVGDCTLEQVTPSIERYLAALPSGRPTDGYIYKGHDATLTDTALVRNAGDNPRASVSMFFQSDEIAGELRRQSLMDDVAKGILRTLLLDQLREKMNMVYSVGVSNSSIGIPSDLCRVAVGFSCKPEDVDTLIAHTFKELQMAVDHPDSISTALADVKLNLKKTWNTSKQHNLYWTGGIRDVLYRGDKDWSYLGDYGQIIDSVTEQEVADYIKRYILDAALIKGILLPKEGVTEDAEQGTE